MLQIFTRIQKLLLLKRIPILGTDDKMEMNLGDEARLEYLILTTC